MHQLQHCWTTGYIRKAGREVEVVAEAPSHISGFNSKGWHAGTVNSLLQTFCSICPDRLYLRLTMPYLYIPMFFPSRNPRKDIPRRDSELLLAPSAKHCRDLSRIRHFQIQEEFSMGGTERSLEAILEYVTSYSEISSHTRNPGSHKHSHLELTSNVLNETIYPPLFTSHDIVLSQDTPMCRSKSRNAGRIRHQAKSRSKKLMLQRSQRSHYREAEELPSNSNNFTVQDHVGAYEGGWMEVSRQGQVEKQPVPVIKVNNITQLEARYNQVMRIRGCGFHIEITKV